MGQFVSRGGEKLDHALTVFAIDVANFICADFGSNTGGFTDCLLGRAAARVYAIDTGYGVLDWKLRRNPRVIVMERTNAMHAKLPEMVDLATIDVAWTKQRNILPAARRILKPGATVVTLIKPHYEADPKLLIKGVLPPDEVDGVVEAVQADIRQAQFEVIQMTRSPIVGAKGNIEVLACLHQTTHSNPGRRDGTVD